MARCLCGLRYLNPSLMACVGSLGRKKNLNLASCTLTSTNLPWHTHTCHKTHKRSINQSINKQTVGVYFLPQVYQYVSNFSSVHEKRKISTYKLQTCLCCRINRLEVGSTKAELRLQVSQKSTWWASMRIWVCLMPVTDIRWGLWAWRDGSEVNKTCSSHRGPGCASKHPQGS